MAKSVTASQRRTIGGKNEMKTKVAVYCRVAAKDQIAIDCQKTQLQHYINSHPGWDAGTVYTDVAPANRLAEGSDLARLLEDAAKGEFQRVAVLSVSRLARDFVRLLQLINTLKENGVTVDFLKEGISSDDIPVWEVSRWLGQAQ